MITSTLLTLLVIPTVYEILDDVRAWVQARIAALAGNSRHEPALGAPDPVHD